MEVTSVPNASWKLLLTAGLLSSVLAVPAARAGDDLVKMQSNAADYVMPTQTYDNHRYSALKQINAQNVGKLQVTWEFSTGVLRGHEGIGGVMYLTTPFPNIVYALDLNQGGRILWKYEPRQDPNVIAVMAATPSTAASRMPTARSSCIRRIRLWSR